MSEKVELIIEAPNSEAIRNIKETQKAFQDLHKTSQQGMRREKGLIEDIEGELKRLQEAKRKAYTVESIEKYNKKIQEAKRDLEEYEKAGLKVEKQTESLTKSFSKWILSLGGAVAILHKLKEAFLETTAGINAFNTASAVTKTVLNDIVTTGQINISTIRQTIATQKVLNELRVEEIAEGIKLSKLGIEYQENYVKALDQTLTKEEQLKAVDAALAAHNEKINIQVEHLQKSAETMKELIDKTLVPSEKMVEEYAKIIIEINNLEAERDASTKRLQSRRSGIIADAQKAEKDNLDNWLKSIEDENKKSDEKRLKEFQDFWDEWNKIEEEALKEAIKINDQLRDEYNKTVVDTAPLVASLKLQKNLAINELEKLKSDIIRNIGALTPEQEKYFDVLAKNIDTQFKESIDEVINPDMLGTYLKNTLSKGIQTDIIPQKEELKSIWSLFGIDPESEKGQEQIDAIQEGADTIMGIMDDVFSRRVELAERERELIDDRISQLQNELEFEAELMEEGFANNVDAKRKELDELKKQRQQALADEEAAIKRQQTFEAISQATSLMSAVANILKSFTKLGPFGLALASGAIATMYLLFASAKAKASDATKLAEGGSGSDTGVIKGKRHVQGGERFLDHLEVEHGEAWGVLSRRASGKYGKVFHEMVSSFNRDEMPDFIASPISNNIKINNDGSNSRLDKLIYENRRLRNDMNQSRQYTIGNKRVVQKGKNTRIIG